MTATIAPTQFQNQLLSLLPEPESELLAPYLTHLQLKTGDVLISPGASLQFAYFPETAIASMVALPDAERVEAVSIGREGFVGLPLLLGGETLTETIIQIAGAVHRISAKNLMAVLPQTPVLRAILQRYVLTVVEEISLTAACNRAHPLAERCAKWLLLVRDRRGDDIFLLTHKFLATMLGVRRAGVTVAAGVLQKAGIIRYKRGKVTVVNREALEDAACRCYELIRTLQQRHTDIPDASAAHEREAAIQ